MVSTRVSKPSLDDEEYGSFNLAIGCVSTLTHEEVVIIGKQRKIGFKLPKAKDKPKGPKETVATPQTTARRPGPRKKQSSPPKEDN